MSEPKHIGDCITVSDLTNLLRLDHVYESGGPSDIIFLTSSTIQALDSYRRQLPPEHPCHLKPL